MDAFKFSLINKLVGQQYSDTTNTPFYKLGAYDDTIQGRVRLGIIEFGVGIYNIFNERNLLSVASTTKARRRRQCYDCRNRGASLDQYYFQPSRSYQFNLTARF